MENTFTTTDGEKIRKVGRYKKIYLNEKGFFFVWNGRREYFDNIPRLSFPVMYEDEAGKLGVIGGYITISNCFGVYVEEHPDGEKVQLWEVVAE